MGSESNWGNRVVGWRRSHRALVRYRGWEGAEIVVVNRSKKGWNMFRNAGVIPVSSETESVMDAVKQVTQGELADIVFETTG